ncbi:MAG: SMC family ATPase [bacterium]|nr:SMC family ATPase [bacterium]
MVIKNLKLTNYRRFRHLELEFPENIIGILGSNGAGKTTIVEAIGWCLYGNRIRRTDKLDIRSQFAAATEASEVELIFSCGGNDYRLLRKLKGKNAAVEAAIYLNADTEPAAVQERGVNEFIESLLNLDYRSFIVSVFARQKDLAALSMFQPEERRKSIARLINIDAIDRSRVDVRVDRKGKIDTQSGIKTSIRDNKELKANKKKLAEKLEVSQQRLEDLKQKLADCDKIFKATKSEYEKLSEIRDRYHQIVARIEKWTTFKAETEQRKAKQLEQIESIEQAQQQYKKLSPMLRDYNKIQREKDRLDKSSGKYFQLKAFQAEKKRLFSLVTKEQVLVTKLTEELKGFESFDKKLSELDQLIKQMQQQRETVRRELSQNEGLIVNITAKGKETRQKNDQIEKLGPDSPCPVCTRPLKEHYQTVHANFQNELATLRKQYSQYEKTDHELKEKIQHLDNQLLNAQKDRDAVLQALEQRNAREKQLKQHRDTLEELNQNLETVNKNISNIGDVVYNEKQHKEVQKNYKELSAVRDRLLKIEENVRRLPDEKQELEQLEKALTDQTTEIEREQQQLKSLSFNEENYSELRKNMEVFQQQLESAKDENHAENQKELSIQKDLERIEQEIKTNQALKKQINQLKQEIVYLDALDYHLGLFRQELSGRIRPLIAARASELLHLTTQGRYTILELDEDYNIYLFDQTDKFPLIRFSGGEQDLANLCLRIAVSQVVAERAGRSQINFIVLDEIFGSQDEQRKELIMTALQRLFSQFRQIFIITHVESIKDGLPVIVLVEPVSDMESRATMI